MLHTIKHNLIGFARIASSLSAIVELKLLIRRIVIYLYLNVWKLCFNSVMAMFSLVMPIVFTLNAL